MKQELPHSARNALARQAAADEHPSADLLTGFVEHSLSPAEKDRVTSHLSACADCREIVFLASAATQPEQQVAESTATLPARRLRWTSWKWLAPTVAALLIVTAVVVEREQAPEAAPAMRQTAELRQPSAPPKTQAATVSSENQAPASGNKRLALGNKPPALSTQKKSTASGELSGAVEHQYKLPSEPQGGNDLTYIAQGAAAPQPNGGNDLSYKTKNAVAAPSNEPGQHSSLNTAAGSPAARSATTKAAPAPPPLQLGAAASAVPSASGQVADATQSAPKVQAEASDLVAKAEPMAGLQKPQQRAAMAAVRWRITDDGHLERSITTGEWTRVLSDEPVSFHAIAVIGMQVWAGGSDGALFRSTDDGENWTRVSLTQSGQSESSTVKSIRFDTASEGSVTTGSGTTWKTTDGGKSWSRQ